MFHSFTLEKRNILIRTGAGKRKVIQMCQNHGQKDKGSEG